MGWGGQGRIKEFEKGGGTTYCFFPTAARASKLAQVPKYLWGLVPLQGTPLYQVLEFQAVILSLHHFLPLVCLRTVVIHGQCYSGGLHKQTRGHPLHTPERPSGGAVDMVQAQGYYPDRLVQPGAGQAYCGLPVPRPRSPLGVDPPLPGHGHYFPNVRSPSRGSVCVGTLCPAPEVLCAGSGSGSVANRAFPVRWEGFTGYAFPPTSSPEFYRR